MGGDFPEPLRNRIGPAEGRAGSPPAPDPFPNAIAKDGRRQWPVALGTETPPAPQPSLARAGAASPVPAAQSLPGGH